MKMHIAAGCALALSALVPAMTASADPKQGTCPAGPSGFEALSPKDAAADIFPFLIAGPDTVEELELILSETEDLNGNDLICVATRTQQNPNAHWGAEAPYFVTRDDNSSVR